MARPADRADPTSESERIEALDILRGFALFGILVVNMTVFSGSGWHGDPSPGTADRLTVIAVEWLAEGKFLNMFSFLFGVGVSLQLERLRARTGRPGRIMSRRLFGLLLMGLAHGILIAWVDVLQAYALLGYVLLLLSATRTGVVFGLMIVCFLAPVGYALFAPADPADAVTYAEWSSVYADGDYATLVRTRIDFWIWIYSSADWHVSVIGVEVVLLLAGMLFGRSTHLQRLGTGTNRYGSRIAILVLAGLLLTAIALGGDFGTADLPDALSAAISDRVFLLGALCISGAYAFTLMAVFRRDEWRPRLGRLASAGRMALTNYILQSIICTFIFYEYGLGLYGEVGPFHGFLLTAVIFTGQLLLSAWWLERARFGPLEWAWRSFTYGKMQPLMRKQQSTDEQRSEETG